jgi:trk system potassium uptake protein
MINWRIITRIFSLLLIIEGLFMILSAGVSWLYNEPSAYSLLWSALITLFSGIIVFTPMRKVERVTGKKEGYIIITGSWVLYTLFGTLPYLFSGSVTVFIDAFFESMSGFTTTGATIFSDPGSLPNGILFWRSLTQWMGGAGIIVISLYVLPVFKDIYIQLPAGEFAGQATDKIHPRMREASARLLIIYAILTFLQALLLLTGNVPFLDAICISFSTLSTGGFTPYSDNIGALSNHFPVAIITLFMFIAGLNMSYIYFGIKRNFSKVFRNSEFLFYLGVCVGFALIVSAILAFKPGISAGQAFLNGSFHVISIVTTTGFFTGDHQLWGNVIIIILFVLMFTGGTYGSASSGIKMVRLLLSTKNSRQELIRLLHPNAFIPVRLDNKMVPQNSIFNLLVFVMLYFLVICLSSFVFSFMGYDLVTSFSTSASMLANIGPGLGKFGPFTNFSQVPVAGKWFMSSLMLLGRLELLTVIVLFTRTFYIR